MMSAEDVELRIQAETDPRMMAELGGPRPREDIERAHAKSLVMAAEGRCWPLKVIPDGSTSPAGTVMIWETTHEGETIYEIGWTILPEFQNKGIATQAVREILEKARAERKFGQIHAFPGITNGPSNRICEKNGFTNLGVHEVEFAGHTIRSNLWRIDLRAGLEDPHLEHARVAPIREAVTVRGASERVFDLFTERMGTWWPIDAYSRVVNEFADEGVEVTRLEFQARLAGSILEHLSDGRVLPWAEVVTWDPPRSVVMAWRPHSLPEPPTEVEATFTASEGGTLVEVEHRGWEAVSEGFREALYEIYARGWVTTLGCFAAAAERDLG